MTATANLLLAGFDVEVFEQAPELSEVGTGIQLSAISMRLLRHLGLVERLRRLGMHPPAYQFKMFESGEILQEIPFDDGYVELHGVPYLSVHRADLLDSLIRAIRALNAERSAWLFSYDPMIVDLR